MPVREFRKRYVAFKIDAPREVQRWELIGAVQRMADSMGMAGDGVARPWLTAYRDNRGILRCSHTDKEKAIQLLTSINEIGEERMPVKIETIVTSGTIKKEKTSLE